MRSHLSNRLVAVVTASVLVFAPGLSRSVLAWGAVGHHVVARIAWARLTPAARSAVTTLLGGGREEEFIAASTWADDVRGARPETYNWHFVDIPVDQD